MPRWLVTITFGEEGIEYCAAFKKKTVKPYSSYPYVYRAWYRHGGMLPIGYDAVYIVISQGKLSSEELQHINQVGISDAVIKIRYSKNVYETLQEILPDKHRYRLENSFHNEVNRAN